MRETLDKLSDTDLALGILDKIKKISEEFYEKKGRKPIFMEVCGSHTMAFAKTGVKQAIEKHVTLISGPGCPVCVTDQSSIDGMIELSRKKNVIVCTFGDMIRVPGSNGSLMDEKSKGGDIHVVYSPLDAVSIAKENPEKEVVFLGIGFETTIPLLGVAIDEAIRLEVNNFSIWMNTKLVEPILKYLMDLGELEIDGFLLPGHVSIVLGKEVYQFLAEDYSVSGVISGFEPVELMSGIYHLVELQLKGKPAILNNYSFVVKDEGNDTARQYLTKYFTYSDEAWRGIGIIAKSGLDFKEQYSEFNAKEKLPIKLLEPRKTKCRCGEIIRGVITPPECKLFGKACRPTNPIGPCMVSSEGTCSAYYQYMREEI